MKPTIAVFSGDPAGIGSEVLAKMLADPQTRSLLDRYFPGVADDQRIAMARGMTLRAIQPFAPSQFTDAALDALDADLAALAA